VAELLIFFAVLYHALNGLRIIIQDFWPIAMLHQRRLAWAAAGITAVAILPVAWIMLAPLFDLRPEPGAERHERRMRERGQSYELQVSAPAQQTVPPVSMEGGR
jgi:succinate dehydrogenase hydrophobic anchor subunit